MKLKVLPILLLAMTACNYDPNKNPAVVESKRQAQQVFDDAMAEYEKRAIVREMDRIEGRDGLKAMRLYYRCKGEPPKQKANQEACRTLIERIAREDAAEAATAEAARQKSEKTW